MNETRTSTPSCTRPALRARLQPGRISIDNLLARSSDWQALNVLRCVEDVSKSVDAEQTARGCPAACEQRGAAKLDFNLHGYGLPYAHYGPLPDLRVEADPPTTALDERPSLRKPTRRPIGHLLRTEIKCPSPRFAGDAGAVV